MPAAAVSVSPTRGVPAMDGGTVSTGVSAGAAATAAVGAEFAVAEPAAFDAVTATRTVAPTSLAPSV